MFEIALIAFTTFFATIGPLDVAIAFAALTAGYGAAERRATAIKGIMVASALVLIFVLFGKTVLALFGISLPALRIAGGLLLFMIAVDMVFARPSGGTSTTREEDHEAAGRPDISVFPLATPLIVGPGAISAVILLMADARGDPLHIAVVVGALVVNLGLTFGLLLVAGQVQRVLGITGVHVVSRIVGILIAALAVQFVLLGLAETSTLFHTP
jgi:multiple antibiotic resistance protein